MIKYNNNVIERCNTYICIYKHINNKNDGYTNVQEGNYFTYKFLLIYFFLFQEVHATENKCI